MTKMSVSLKLSHKNNNNDFCMTYIMDAMPHKNNGFE